MPEDGPGRHLPGQLHMKQALRCPGFDERQPISIGHLWYDHGERTDTRSHQLCEISGAEFIPQRQNGVSGGGLAVIEAAGEIHGKFFEGASLTANEGIYANYVMNSNMIAGKEIVIAGSRGAIIGGTAAAVNGVTAHHIGNRAGLPTIISLGVSKAMIEKEEL